MNIFRNLPRNQLSKSHSKGDSHLDLIMSNDYYFFINYKLIIAGNVNTVAKSCGS